MMCLKFGYVKTVLCEELPSSYIIYFSKAGTVLTSAWNVMLRTHQVPSSPVCQLLAACPCATHTLTTGERNSRCSPAPSHVWTAILKIPLGNMYCHLKFNFSNRKWHSLLSSLQLLPHNFLFMQAYHDYQVTNIFLLLLLFPMWCFSSQCTAQIYTSLLTVL